METICIGNDCEIIERFVVITATGLTAEDIEVSIKSGGGNMADLIKMCVHIMLSDEGAALLILSAAEVYELYIKE